MPGIAEKSSSKSLLGRRTAGVLLHPTSLPSPLGIGDLGATAREFLDFLAAGHQQVWQMLPVGPPGRGNSPYDSASAFAGSGLLIDLFPLAEAGWLSKEAVSVPPTSHQRKTGKQAAPAIHRVRYREVKRRKGAALRHAWTEFRNRASHSDLESFRAFQDREHAWLDDFTLFATLHNRLGTPWSAWPDGLRDRKAAALRSARREHADEIELHCFIQFVFDKQWNELRQYGADRGVSLVGDVPIYVALESADVWAHPKLFDLGRGKRPRTVAGVPPDYFNRNGQLWGQPTYVWAAHRRSRFAWWCDRLRHSANRYDALRLDHFLGFERGWAVSARAPTARKGRWVKGPGDEFFRAVADQLGDIALLAEDLGAVTEEAEALRLRVGIPGMRVLQFGLTGPATNDHLPHRYPEDTVAYTGTHDNETSRGWIERLNAAAPRRKSARESRDFALSYLDTDLTDFTSALVRTLFASPARTVVVPMQDHLNLGAEARMNRPGSARGNWAWRLAPDRLTPPLVERLRTLSETYERSVVKSEGEEHR